jgi:hypothetical protein
MTLALKLFRGEQAISEFVWHITPTHSSSPNFVTLVGSGLHEAFTPVSPWPWVAHPVSCLIPATIRPIQTRFRYGCGCICLNLATEINSQAHSPRGTPSGLLARTRISAEHRPSIALRLLVGLRFQVLFHSPHWGTFHLSLTVLVHYRSPDVFSLGEWTPQLPAGLACPAVLRYPTGDKRFSLRGSHPLWQAFPHLSTNHQVL